MVFRIDSPGSKFRCRCWLLCCLGAFIAVCGGEASVAAAAAPKLAVHSSAASIRAARHTAVTREWRMVFRITIARGDTAPATSTIRIGLGPDYFQISSGENFVIYDFSLARALHVDVKRRTFFLQSLFGIIAFRGTETKNRLGLFKAGRATGLDLTASMQPFWVESDLGIAISGDRLSGLRRTETGVTSLAYSYQGEQVFRADYSKTEIPKTVHGPWQRLFRYIYRVHPRIISMIIASGLLPRRLEFVQMTMNRKTTTTLELTRAGWQKADYPLPRDFKPSLHLNTQRENGLLKKMLPTMVGAVMSDGAGGSPTPDSMAGRIERALSEDRNFDGVILSLEAVQMFSRQAKACRADPGSSAGFCRMIRAGFKAGISDPNYGWFRRALTHGTQGRLKESVALFRRIPSGEFEAGYVVDRAIANDLTRAIFRQNVRDVKTMDRIRPEIETRFIKALNGNPYYRNLYRDIGNYFLANFRYTLGWIVFDLGRVLPKPVFGDVLAPIDRLEVRLRRLHPEFF